MEPFSVVEALRQTLGPWPTVGLLLGAVALPFLLVMAMFAQSLKIGPLAIEIRKTARELDMLSVAMAESRITELEVTARQAISTLSDADRKELRRHVDALKEIVAKVRMP